MSIFDARNIHAWQHYIEDEKIVPLQGRFSLGDFTVVGHEGLVASFSEGAGDMLS